ncbi:hypothetical protein BB560_004938 [Smittium megazygosporum]|uniref:Enoyl-CoA hydratase n=1 Tax=Smittium megazygosporum TaxID=133381 RepID=A0A2T9Z7U9_9FUNG|nr:hypothetical protein BB560_004938 [Smittium megazygosporum]
MTIFFPNEKTPDIKLYKPDPLNYPTIFVIEFVKLPENRITEQFIASVNYALDAIEKELDSRFEDYKTKLASGQNPKDYGGAVITTSTGKFYSNGLDVTLSVGNQRFHTVNTRLNARFLSFRLPTIAAVNGHAFAGGCLMACAHDYVVMGENRGFICTNEIDINLPLSIGPIELFKSRVSSPPAVTKALLEGYRFTAKEAQAIGLVDIAVPNPKVFETAFNLAKEMSPKAQKGGHVFSIIKQAKNKTAIEALKISKLNHLALTYNKL